MGGTSGEADEGSRVLMGPPGQEDGLWRGATQARMGLKAPFLSAVLSMTHTHLEKACVLPRPARGLWTGSW